MIYSNQDNISILIAKIIFCALYQVRNYLIFMLNFIYMSTWNSVGKGMENGHFKGPQIEHLKILIVLKGLSCTHLTTKTNITGRVMYFYLQFYYTNRLESYFFDKWILCDQTSIILGHRGIRPEDTKRERKNS